MASATNTTTTPTKPTTGGFKEFLKVVYEGVKKISLQIFGGLLMDKKEGMWIVSMTKAATWIILGHCMFIWNKALDLAAVPATANAISQAITRQDVSQGEVYTLWALLGVGVAKIGAKAFTDIKGNGSGE